MLLPSCAQGRYQHLHKFELETVFFMHSIKIKRRRSFQAASAETDGDDPDGGWRLLTA